MPAYCTFVNILMELLQMTTKIYNIDVVIKKLFFLSLVVKAVQDKVIHSITYLRGAWCLWWEIEASSSLASIRASKSSTEYRDRSPSYFSCMSCTRQLRVSSASVNKIP